MMYDSPGAASQLDLIARELAGISDRILDAGAVARSLSAATDWQSPAAEAFHARAEEWAREISGLVCLAETARLAAGRARDAVLFSGQAGF